LEIAENPLDAQLLAFAAIVWPPPGLAWTRLILLALFACRLRRI